MQSTRTSLPTSSRRICKAIISPHSAPKRRFGMMTTYPFSFPSPFITTEDLFPRLLDHHSHHLHPTFHVARRWGAQFPTAPRFDVKERTSAFELQGEIPGLRKQDVVIEFVDPRTLVIRGRVEREETGTETNAETPKGEGKGKGKDSEGVAAQAADVDGNTKSQRATVEDEGQATPAADDDKSTTSTTVGANTPTSSVEGKTSSTPAVAEQETTVTANLSSESKYQYWLNERAVIEQFERRFKFPGDVDQEAVKASLRNGILSVVVPKVVKAAKEGKRIVVEG